MLYYLYETNKKIRAGDRYSNKIEKSNARQLSGECCFAILNIYILHVRLLYVCVCVRIGMDTGSDIPILLQLLLFSISPKFFIQNTNRTLRSKIFITNFN